MLNAATLFVEGEEQEVTALQPDEVPGINEVSAFHSIKSKTNDLAVRVLEADGSATVARNPVELFLVITNDAGGPDLQQHVWRLPRGVADVKRITVDKSALNISAIVDGPLDEQTGRSQEQNAIIHIAYHWSNGILSDKISITTSGP